MKVLIVGSVGSGKTTLAKEISEKSGHKYYEIDSIVHDDQNDGMKRNLEERNLIIEKILKNDNWIIEGVLRKNMYFILELAEKVIFLDTPIFIIFFRIVKRFLKQKLKVEKCNYKPTFKMLFLMYKWSFIFFIQKKELKKELEKYNMISIRNKKDIL